MITTCICPNCKAPLCILEPEDSDVLCYRCNARYVPTFATLYAAEWRIKEARSNLEHSMRIYDLRLAVQGQIQSLEFSLPVQKAVLRFMPNDRLLVLRTQGQRLALLQNITAVWTAPLIESAVARTATTAFIAVVVVLLGWTIGMNFTSKYAPYIGAGLGVSLSFFIVKKGRQRHFIETDEKAIAKLIHEQELLQQIQVLQAKIEELVAKKRHQVNFQASSASLNRQLMSVPQSDHQQSIITRGSALAQKHELVLERLIEGYQRRLEQVQIVLNAYRLVDELPENQLFEDMAELELLEQQQQDIEAQLSSLTFNG